MEKELSILDFKPFELTKGQEEALLKIESQIKDFKLDYTGLKNNHEYMLAGYAGVGKLQPNHSIIYTQNKGKITMGEIEIGDIVFGQKGEPVVVDAIYPKSNLDIYKITFSDDSVVECCNEHLWKVQTNKQRQNGNYSILELQEIIDAPKFHVSDKVGYKYSVDLCEPVEFLKKDLKLHPYLMGILLGNGYLPNTTSPVQLTVHEKYLDEFIKYILEIIPNDVKIHIDRNDYGSASRTIRFTNSIKNYIRDYNLLGKKSKDKFIPHEYLYSSIEDRLELLKGLMDTDGSIELFSTKKKIRYSSKSFKLIENVTELIRSLGGLCSINISNREHDNKGIEWNLNIRTRQNCFKLKDKFNKFENVDFKFHFKKKMIKIEYVGKMDGRCIRVNSNDHLYLTNDFTITHNTSIAINILNWYRNNHDLQIRNTLVLALTNKAVQVLQSKINIPIELSTIHAAIYGTPKFDQQGNYIWQQAVEIRNTLILIDECSMLNKQIVEDIKKVSTNCFIIYMGDNFQSEPIGEDPKLFDLPNKSQLTEVKRVTNDILKLATHIRTIKRNVIPSNESKDITLYPAEEKGYFLKKFVEVYKQNSDSVIIVATNMLRNTLNNKTRELLGYGTEILAPNDKLLSISNSEKFSNGDSFEIQNFKFLEKVDLTLVKGQNTKDISVYLYLLNNQAPLILIPNYDKPSLYHQEIQTALGFDNIKKYKAFMTPRIKDGEEDWSNARFGKHVIIATYGYALSGHKAQGSEFNNVFVIQDYCAKNWNSARWFYTAITRSNSKLHILPNYKLQQRVNI